MHTITIEIPDAIDDMGEELKVFVEAMVHKLAANAHKTSVNEYDIPYLMGRLLIECGEFLEQHHADLRDKNNLYELADIANFAVLINIALGIHISDLDRRADK